MNPTSSHNQIFIINTLLSAYNVRKTERSVGSITTLTIKKHKNKTNPGKVFEQEFFNSFPDNIFIQRVKDDMLGYKNARNYCDFITFCPTILYLFELKSTKQKSLPFGNVSQFQVDTLYHYSKYKGIKAGFIINFRSHNYQTFFLPADRVYSYYYNGDRKSFSLEWVQENGIVLPASLIRTRYRFDLSPLFQSQ